MDSLDGFEIEVEIDGLAADFSGPLVVGPVQDPFGGTAAVGFSASVQALLNGTGEDVAQRGENVAKPWAEVAQRCPKGALPCPTLYTHALFRISPTPPAPGTMYW